MKQFLKQKNNLIYAFYLIVLFACFSLAVLAFHDVQTAQGVGLYYAGKVGHDNRLLFDIFVDIIGSLLIALSIAIPIILLKRYGLISIVKFTLIYFAMIPFINPASLVHLTSQITNWSLRPAFVQGNIWFGFIEGLTPPSSVFLIEIPLFVLVYSFNAQQNDSYKINLWKKILFVISFVCFILYVFFPGFGEYSLFFVHYPFVIIIFDEIECLLKNNPTESKSFKILSVLFFGVCGLRGIYRMIDLMQNTHL